MGNGTDGTIDDLHAELARYPADRYPVQHATARFHLGLVLLESGRAEDALETLVTAARLFDPDHLPVEHAKATNMAGVALRTLGRLDDAAGAFVAAVRVLDAVGEARECGAALYNLGVVERDRRDLVAAEELLEAALRVLEEAGGLLQVAAAGRELGATLLERDDAERAEAVLGRATEVAERAGDLATLGSCANVHGLALLAVDRTEEAIAVLRAAAGAHPRTVRPDGYAMAKANLALAYERCGDVGRARIAARQALATPDIPSAVAEQADETLLRLPDGAGDLVPVLLEEGRDRWPGIVGEEVVRWAAEGPVARRREARALARALAARQEALELAEVWLGALLELPPDPMERLIGSFLEAVADLDPAATERVRAVTGSAMVRFHGPQWMRMKETFNRLAGGSGTDAVWG